MKRTKINMTAYSMYTGEEFECEKTGIKLTKFTPIKECENKYGSQYSVFNGNRNFVLPEEVFNIIKNLMI